MAAAAHDIGRAEHNEITPLSGFARGFLIDRKFGDADALCPKAPSHRRACIVMREHPHIGRTRNSRKTRDRVRHFIAARHHVGDETVELLAGKAAALHHAGAFLRLVEIGNRGIHVIIERE